MKEINLRDIELNKIYVAVSKAEAFISNKCFVVMNNDTEDKDYKYMIIEGTYKYVYDNLDRSKISPRYVSKDNDIITLVKDNVTLPYTYGCNTDIELKVYDIENVKYNGLDNEKFNIEVLKCKSIILNEVSKHLKYLEDLKSTIIDNNDIFQEYLGISTTFKQLISVYSNDVILENNINLDDVPTLKSILDTPTEKLLDNIERDKYIYVKDSLRIEPELDYDGECCSIYNTRYIIDGYVCKMPSDNVINNLAIQFTIYNNISKAFNTPDCTVVKQYLDGDLTWKGLLKHIDIKHTITC